MKKRKKWRGVSYLWGASGVMYRTRHEDSPLSIYHNGFLIIGNSALNELRTQKTNQSHEQAQLGYWVGFHFFSSLFTFSSIIYINLGGKQNWNWKPRMKWWNAERGESGVFWLWSTVNKNVARQQKGPFLLWTPHTVVLKLWEDSNMYIYIYSFYSVTATSVEGHHCVAVSYKRSKTRNPSKRGKRKLSSN